MPSVDFQAELARSCGWWWTYERLAILTERPVEIHVDSDCWLHCENGPALAYRDGVEVFAWHGRLGLKPKAIVAPASLTLDDVDAEIDPGLRQAMIDLFGRDRYREQSEAQHGHVAWVTYRRLPGVGGSGHPLPEHRARLDDFLHALPYFLTGATGTPALPPLAVLNSVLVTGRADAGMSGGAEWQPFELGEPEYDALVELVKSSGSMRVLPRAPEWVQTESAWRIWREELERGVPSGQHRELRAVADAAHAAWKTAWDDAVRENDPLLVVRRLDALLSAERAVQDLREGRTVGSADAGQQTAESEVARRARDAQLALRAAERIGDPRLIKQWQQEHELAQEALRAQAGSDDAATLALSLTNAIS